jgi:hypothetical protein
MNEETQQKAMNARYEKAFKESRKANERLKVYKWMPYEDEIARYYSPRIREWIDSPNRKWSVLAFTSGLGREIASLIEYAESKTDKKKYGDLNDE